MAAHSLDTGIRGAYHNVTINLKQVKDEDYLSSVNAEVKEMLQEADTQLDRVLEIAKNRK